VEHGSSRGVIAQTLSVNAGSRAVLEWVGLSYVRTFPSFMTASVAGVEEGEVEYELTRRQWEGARSETFAGPNRWNSLRRR
jgi:RimJ/RimL family protein N-acetyltransferase